MARIATTRQSRPPRPAADRPPTGARWPRWWPPRGRSPSTCWPPRRYAGRRPSRRTSRSNGEPGTGPLLDALRRRRQAGDPAGAAARRRPRLGGVRRRRRRWSPRQPRAARAGRRRARAPTPSRPPTSCWCPAWRSTPPAIRLGRGGGSYDRALGRVPVGTFTCVLLYDDEVGVPVPVEPHDRPVGWAATPAGVVRLGS